MEQEIEIKRQEREKTFFVEPDDIHQRMYEIATKAQTTTLHLDPIGGSENFQGGSENVHKWLALWRTKNESSWASY